MTTNQDAAARRLARSLGLTVRKARHEKYVGCGRYFVTDADRRLVSSEYGLHLEDLQALLVTCRESSA